MGDVAGALPKALRRLGVDARVILPKYKGIEGKGLPLIPTGKGLACEIGASIVEGKLLESTYDGVPAYLIEKDEYFLRDYVYGTPEGDYQDNCERFTFFCKATIESMRVTGFIPDVVHCNDWETALIPVFLRTVYKDDPLLRRVATLFTIHNLGYQGIFWRHDMHILGLGWEYFTPEYLEFFGMINLLKGGIVFSDLITTVSSKYREEIMTEEFGFGLDGVLRKRSEDVYGVLNGIDYEEWNPETDPFIPERYGEEDLGKKHACKIFLKQRLRLLEGETPLIATISRLAEQKGIGLILASLPEILSLGVQYVILGDGESRYEEALLSISRQFRGSMHASLGYDERLAHLILAGSDMCLLPSRYEPCGLTQMSAMRYGTVPIVHGVGGLDETVIDCTADPDLGTGFKFYGLTKERLLDAVGRAVSLWRQREAWRALMKRCMRQDFSWHRPALAYKNLYGKAIGRHSGL